MHRTYRWYIANPVRFQHSLKVEIQNQRGQEGRQVPSRDDYISTAFWYSDQVSPTPLALYAERIAPTKATEYRK